MPSYDILLKTFTTRKIMYLYGIGKFVTDIRTCIPALNNIIYRINGGSYRRYLSGLTSLTGASLHSSYARQVASLERDGIFQKNNNNDLVFTELGLSVVNFFNGLREFFGEEDFFKFLKKTKDHFKKEKTKSIFLFVISEVITIARNLELLWRTIKTVEFMIKEGISFEEMRNIKEQSIYEPKMPVKRSIVGYLKTDDFKDFIKNVALSLKKLPAYKERRQTLINTIDTAFQILLGKNYDKKNLTEFLYLESTFRKWGLLQSMLRPNIQPPLGFEEKLSTILKEEIQHDYALVLEKLGKGDLQFCSETLRKNQPVHGSSSVSNEIIEIINFLKHIGDVFNIPYTELKLIEISIPIPYIEQESKPYLYLIPFKKGFFLLTALTPLYWCVSLPIRKISIAFPEQFTITDHAYYTFQDDSFIDLNQFDISVIYYLLRILELVVDRIFFRKFHTGRIIQDLRREWGFKSELYDTYRINSEIIKGRGELNFEKINTKEDPLYDSENLCNWAIPRVKIYYDNYFISSAITIEPENHVYFQVFKSKTSPNPVYPKIVRLVENSLK